MANDADASNHGEDSAAVWVAVVDDDASVRRALARRLSADGLTVRVFASAQEYLAAAAYGRVACVVLDVHLGAMSGFELYDHLREEGAAVPVILITAYDEISSDDLARHSGSSGSFLRKPFDSDQLVALVQKALDQFTKAR